MIVKANFRKAFVERRLSSFKGSWCGTTLLMSVATKLPSPRAGTSTPPPSLLGSVLEIGDLIQRQES